MSSIYNKKVNIKKNIFPIWLNNFDNTKHSYLTYENNERLSPHKSIKLYV